MNGKRIRYQQTGEFHFLTFSCFHRLKYFAAASARDLFEDALECARQRYLLGSSEQVFHEGYGL
jgi:hypothetical protein